MNCSTREFAELTGVTIKALRHYERLGLLSPKRNDARYRIYSIEDCQRLERVLALKSLGLPLNTIKTLMNGGDAGFRRHRQALEEKRARLDRAIEALETIESGTQPADALDRFVGDAAWDRWVASLYDSTPEIFERVATFVAVTAGGDRWR